MTGTQKIKSQLQRTWSRAYTSVQDDKQRHISEKNYAAMVRVK